MAGRQRVPLARWSGSRRGRTKRSHRRAHSASRDCSAAGSCLLAALSRMVRASSQPGSTSEVSPSVRDDDRGRTSQRPAGGRVVAGSNPVSPIAKVPANQRIVPLRDNMARGPNGVQFSTGLDADQAQTLALTRDLTAPTRRDRASTVRCTRAGTGRPQVEELRCTRDFVVRRLASRNHAVMQARGPSGVRSDDAVREEKEWQISRSRAPGAATCATWSTGRSVRPILGVIARDRQGAVRAGRGRGAAHELAVSRLHRAV